MKPIVKHIFSGLLFTAILLGLLFASSEIIQMKSLVKESNTRDPMSSGSLTEPDNTIDTVIIGDSETYSAFIPLEMWQEHGITVYTCGTTAQQLCYSEEYIKRVFANQSPKVVILETNAIFRDFGYSDIIINEAEKILPILRYHNRWKLLKPKGASFVEGSRGYYYNDDAVPVSKDKLTKPHDKKDRIPDKNKWYVKNIKTLCEKNGAELILVSVPNTQNWNDKRHKLLEKFATDTGVKLIDMNVMSDEIKIDWNTDSRDGGDHLNHSGAMKVSSYLGQYLEDTKYFEDKRGNPDYISWDKAVDDFNKRTGNALNNSHK